MAEHTRSSIVVEAEPAEVMEVIADFARYPEWTGEVKEAEVLSTDDRGRAEQVRLLLDAGAGRSSPRGSLQPHTCRTGSGGARRWLNTRARTSPFRPHRPP